MFLSYFPIKAAPHRVHLLLICLVFFCQSAIPSESKLSVNYVFDEVKSTNHGLKDEYNFDLYFYEALKLALSKSGTAFQLNTISENAMMQGRSSLLIANGKLDVHWLTTSEQNESNLLPVRFPLLKGLIGWRLLLIHKDSVNAFAKIHNVRQLKLYSAGQGHDWPDTRILKFNGFNVEGIAQKHSIMEMLKLKRFDYYPRSVMEVWSDLHYFQVPDIEVEQRLALQYPLAVYFFVNKNNQPLHDAIKTGLFNALEDGSYEALFLKFFANAIEEASLTHG